MNEAQKAVIIFFVLTFLIIGSLYIIYINKKPKYNKNDIIFFYGVTCPHCKNVEEFINQNNLDSKISIIKKEVYYNQTNLSELMNYAKKCNLKEDQVGVPFIYYQGKCYIGDKECIELLKSLTGV
ncbi:MAG: hypothetical protein KQA41_00500 [Candidatus Aenigmarchaeota archaeon]|nr:hypothetical protein [Candidatus Aenigmarchaeota archaeon]MBU5688697.1 hypothetical protein [Candidatus Aenigmarchaeota archaeon]